MMATDRGFESLSGLIEVAATRGFIGLVLDGIDLKALIATERDCGLLGRAAEIARHAGERAWTERLARRAYDIDQSAATGLQLVSILAGNGRCEEAQALLARLPRSVDDEMHRQASAVLHAKAGRAAQAVALFDTLPGRAEGYHPANIAFTTAWEMMEQCHIRHTAAFIAKLVEDYPSNLHFRALNVRCHAFAVYLKTAR
jgi:hypothetical protein